ncbi:MAG TPA: metallopeptidase TldD-related protein [Jatrophihabitantaceae bacterium]|nr:metallopeptidase TldD-related protein [Jatrophihabitantaceae bacterium]
MLTPQEMVEQALARSDADGCIAIASEHSEVNLRWAANSLTTNGRMHDRALTVIATSDAPDGVRAGVVTRSVTTEDELLDVVRAAELASREATPADDAAPLVEPYPNDDDWNAPPIAADVDVFEHFAPQLGAAFDRWRKADRLLFGFAEHQATSYFVGTSTGLRRRYDQPDGRLEMNGKSPDYTRTAWSGTHTEDFTDVDVDAVAAQLDERLDWSAQRIDLPAGRYETILPPTAIADLMIYAYWNASARDADEGRNVYAGKDGGTRIGERLATLPLTLRSDPGEEGVRCAPFEIVLQSEGGLQSVFDNGAAVPPVEWISDGVLTDLGRTRSWAAKSGGQHRSFVDNLVMEQRGVTTSIDEMVADTERGLLLTCLWYIREVDPQTLLLTGLTRDGVYLVENGKVRGAVNNFRFNESPIDLLRRATQAGASEHTMSREWSDYFRRTRMPALRVPDFNMSTVSRAY